MTYTLARLPVPRPTWDLIAGKLRAAGYDHVFHEGTIDMTHIGLEVEASPVPSPHDDPFNPAGSTAMAPMTDAEAYLGRAIRALYLELPAAIADEIKRAARAVLLEARTVRASAVSIAEVVNAINRRIEPSQWTADIEAAVEFGLREYADRPLAARPVPPAPPADQALPLAIALVDPRVLRGERWIRGGSARGDWQMRADGHVLEIRHYETARESADGIAVGWLPWQRCDTTGAGPLTLADLRAPVLGIIEPTEAAP